MNSLEEACIDNGKKETEPGPQSAFSEPSIIGILELFLHEDTFDQATIDYSVTFKYLPVHGDCDKIRLLLLEMKIPIAWEETTTLLKTTKLPVLIRPILEIRRRDDETVVWSCESTQAIFHVLESTLERVFTQNDQRWISVIQFTSYVDFLREELYRQQFYTLKGEISESIRLQMVKEWILKFLGPSLDILQDYLIPEITAWQLPYSAAAASLAGLVILLEGEFPGVLMRFKHFHTFVKELISRGSFKQLNIRFPDIRLGELPRSF